MSVDECVSNLLFAYLDSTGIRFTIGDVDCSLSDVLVGNYETALALDAVSDEIIALLKLRLGDIHNV